MKIEAIDMKEMEDFVFAFQPYKINNEADFDAARKDFDFSSLISTEISATKEVILLQISNKNQHQITELAFDFLIKTTLKYHLNLSTEILEYLQKNDKFFA